MNTREKNNFAMFNAVDSVMNNHQAAVNGFSPLAQAMDGFRRSMTEILRRNHEYLFAAEGAIAAKNKSLHDLIEQAFRIKNAVYALGRKTGDDRLKAAGKLPPSEIKHMREADIEQYCRKIAAIAGEFSSSLAPFGIAVNDIDSYLKTLDTYRRLVNAKEVKAAASKAARKSLFEDFKKTSEILTQDLDTLMELVKINNPDFYDQYKAARSVRNVHAHFADTKKREPIASRATIPIASSVNAPADTARTLPETMNIRSSWNYIPFFSSDSQKPKDFSPFPRNDPKPGPDMLRLKPFDPAFEIINLKKGLNN